MKDQEHGYRAERFLLGKSPDQALCEDRILECADFFAVIDGVTSKSSRRYNGKTGGCYATEVLAHAIESLDAEETALSALSKLDRAVADCYTAEKIAPVDRIQACVILYSKHRREVWSYGDCNLMINEREILHSKKIDEVLAYLRAFVNTVYLLEGGAPETLRQEDRGREAILPFLQKQAIFANRDHELGYGVIDGSGIVERFVRIYSVEKGDHVVLASDGYPRLFSSLARAEAYLEEVLLRDPLSIGENMQTKAIRPGNVSYDDRAYLSFFAE